MQWNPDDRGSGRRGGSAFRNSGHMVAAHAAPTDGAQDLMQKILRKEKPSAQKQHHASDLRSTLDWLRAQGDLIETDKPVDPDLEVTGLQKHMDGGCPILFHNV